MSAINALGEVSRRRKQ